MAAVSVANLILKNSNVVQNVCIFFLNRKRWKMQTSLYEFANLFFFQNTNLICR